MKTFSPRGSTWSSYRNQMHTIKVCVKYHCDVYLKHKTNKMVKVSIIKRPTSLCTANRNETLDELR